MKQETRDVTTKVATMTGKLTGSVPATTAESAISNVFNKALPGIKKALSGNEADANRFLRICLSIVLNDGKLKAIASNNPYTVLGACMEMAALGLDPAIPNEASLVPFKNDVKMIVGYKGVLKNALNAAQEAGRPFKAFVVDCVYASDEFDFQRVPFSLVHKRKPFASKGDLIGFYAYARDCNGMEWAEMMSREEVEDHQKRFCKSINYSDSAFSGGKNFDLYGIKTVMMRLIRRHLPMSAKLSAAIHSMESEDMAEKQILTPTEILGLQQNNDEVKVLDTPSSSGTVFSAEEQAEILAEEARLAREGN